ncbi:MAG: molybdopterin molybdotransferase MoeA [Myxococcota bacterium]|nr:molybdopterin molybdotransferase MoeA [Myxococcota bacterium]
MIDFDEALRIILSHAPGPQEIQMVPLDAAIGQVLAQDIASDVDVPPFDKASMDGFAVRSADVAQPPATLDVVMDVPAGGVPTGRLEPGQAAAVMTGAPVPEGADAVVQVEWTSGFGTPTVEVNRAAPKGMHISPKADILKVGTPVLLAGTQVDVEELSLLAGAGCDPVPVFKQPSVAVLSTGDELVSPGETPGPGKIRNTNGPALIGFLRSLGLNPANLGQVSDTLDDLRAAVGKGLGYDCLLLSGGVSAGAYDFVQDILNEFGVEVHTTRVAVKPGKPTVFGTLNGKMVFGLPGNPVSAMVIARVLAGPALRKRMGYQDPASRVIRARLTSDIRKKPDRLWLVHGTIAFDRETAVTPVKNRGSADLPAAGRGNCLIVAPKDTSLVEKDAQVEVVVWRRCF